MKVSELKHPTEYGKNYHGIDKERENYIVNKLDSSPVFIDWAGNNGHILWEAALVGDDRSPQISEYDFRTITNHLESKGWEAMEQYSELVPFHAGLSGEKYWKIEIIIEPLSRT